MLCAWPCSQPSHAAKIAHCRWHNLTCRAHQGAARGSAQDTENRRNAKRLAAVRRLLGLHLVRRAGRAEYSQKRALRNLGSERHAPFLSPSGHKTVAPQWENSSKRLKIVKKRPFLSASGAKWQADFLMQRFLNARD